MISVDDEVRAFTADINQCSALELKQLDQELTARRRQVKLELHEISTTNRGLSREGREHAKSNIMRERDVLGLKIAAVKQILFRRGRLRAGIDTPQLERLKYFEKAARLTLSSDQLRRVRDLARQLKHEETTQ